jgi:signal transduction histidine kinase/ligand-binding sensor domain-containing protein
VARLVRYIFVSLLFTSTAATVKGQKYPFTHYGVEDGLPQSQVTGITQDAHHQIWVSTLGGIGCFDSKHFAAYTEQDGLADNTELDVAADHSGAIWCGGGRGITSIDRGGLKKGLFRGESGGYSTRTISVDAADRKWVLAGRRLFLFDGGRLDRQTITDSTERITATRTGPDGHIYAAVLNRGIYRFDGASWNLRFPFTPPALADENFQPEVVCDLDFDSDNASLCYFITPGSLYRSTGDLAERLPCPAHHPPFTHLLCGNNGSLWIGSNRGLYKREREGYLLFNESNGFTNLAVFSMFRDSDHRLWFGTDGGGLFCCNDDGVRILDVSQGLSSNVITSVAEFGGEVLIATHGGGVQSYKGGVPRAYLLDKGPLNNIKINFLFKDSKGDLWMGTDDAGLWKTHNGKSSRILPARRNDPLPSYVSCTEGVDSTMWFATNSGCYYLTGGTLIKVDGIHEYCTSLAVVGRDSVAVGTSAGVRLVVGKHFSRPLFPAVSEKRVLCLAFRSPFLFAGTNDNGVYFSGLTADRQQHIGFSEGLASEMVPSLYVDRTLLWVGTGKGVNHYSLNASKDTLIATEQAFNYLPAECDQNAMQRIGDSLWIGTTRGVYIYPYFIRIKPSRPNIVIEEVETDSATPYSAKSSFIAGYELPDSLVLPFGKHLFIWFQDITFDGQQQNCAYQLEGIDRSFSRPFHCNSIDYRALPPGQYIFHVKGVSRFGGASEVASFRFWIQPRFYQTAGFKGLAAIAGVFLLLAAYLFLREIRRRKERLVEQIKLREQENIRLQTAADFHDDLGNKIARINMLSRLLDERNPTDVAGQRQIISKIQTGASEMYDGAKNILWALDPKNDNFTEIVHAITQFGEDLFEGSSIKFVSLLSVRAETVVRLPLGYSHQLLLIFKELFTNALRHSGATTVMFTANLLSQSEVCVEVRDDGRGYVAADPPSGSGLRNIQKRVQKMQGSLRVETQPEKGTTVTIVIAVIKTAKNE